MACDLFFSSLINLNCEGTGVFERHLILMRSQRVEIDFDFWPHFKIYKRTCVVKDLGLSYCSSVCFLCFYLDF